MKYQIKENVFMVEGAVHACIYDLNTRNLYSLNHELADALRELLCDGRIMDESFRPVITQLEELGIIRRGETLRGLKPITDRESGGSGIRHAWIEVTKRCNLRCIHCYEESSPHMDGTMRMEDFMHAADMLAEAEIPSIQFIGGEPLLLGDRLIEMMAYCNGKFEHVEVFTNATLIDEKWIESFKRYQTVVRVSLHSYDESNHEKVTAVPGSFRQTVTAIRLLQEHAVPYTISGIVINGVEVGEKPEEYAITKQDIVRMAGRASGALLNRELAKHKLITPDTFRQPLDIDSLTLRTQRHFCFGTKLYIDTEMDVYPCVMERRFKHGNLRRHTVRQILREEITGLTKDHIHECRVCEYRYACGDCRPDSLRADRYDKPWYCTYRPEEGRWEDVECFLDALGY